MSIHPGSLAEAARALAGPAHRPAALAEAALVPLGARLLAVLFDRAGDGRGRLSGEMDGEPLAPPAVGTSLPLAGGGRRHVLLLPRALGDVLRRRLVLLLDGLPAAAVEPGWLQPPVEDAPALVAGLAPEGRHRLLRLLLTTGGSLLGPLCGADLARAARRLLDLCEVEPLEAVEAASLGPAARVLTYRPPRGAPRPGGEAVLLSARRVTRAGGVASLREAAPAGDLLHVGLPQGVPPGAELILLGPGLQRLSARGRAAQPLPAWAARRDPAARTWARGLLARAVRSGDAPEGLLREMREGAVAPTLVVRHLSATADGVVHVLELSDPDRLVRALRVERGAAGVVAEPRLRPDGRGALAGVLPLPGEAEGGEHGRVRLLLHSGAARLAHDAPLLPYDGAVPPGLAEALDDAGGEGADPVPALARAQFALPARPVRAAARSFGALPVRLRLSLVSPVGEDPDLVRARAALLAHEPGAEAAEVVLVAAEGPVAAGARRLAETLAAVFALPHRVVAVAPGASASDRLRAGLLHAEGEGVLWLGAGVLPAEPGWLAHWARRLGAAGAPPLVTGLVRDHEGAPADGVRADGACDCVGLTRAGAERVLAAPTGHPDPAVLLAAACPGGVAAGPRGAAVRFGAPLREDRMEAVLRASALDLLRGGAA